MTTGQKLVELSGLASGSALAHLLAIVTGGVNKTVFASQMTVCSEVSIVTLVRSSQDGHKTIAANEMTAMSKTAEKRVSALIKTAAAFVVVKQDRSFLSLTTSRAAYVTNLPESSSVRRQRTVRTSSF